MAQQILTLLL